MRNAKFLGPKPCKFLRNYNPKYSEVIKTISIFYIQFTPIHNYTYTSTLIFKSLLKFC